MNGARRIDDKCYINFTNVLKLEILRILYRRYNATYGNAIIGTITQSDTNYRTRTACPQDVKMHITPN